MKNERVQKFRFVKNDNLQYHFFSAGKIFSTRLVHRPGICVHASWIYDGAVTEISRSENLWIQSDTDFMDISSDILSVRDLDGELNIIAKFEDGRNCFHAKVKPQNILKWLDTYAESNDEVLHLPDLIGTLEYKGKVYPTFGYCKHVQWQSAPRYTGYRFLHGIIGDEQIPVWSADAVFGYQKYDYFKMIEDKGEVTVADRELSSHKQNTIYAKVGDRNITVSFEELGSWEMPLINDRIDMVIQQRYGNITYREGDIVKPGVAMTEYGFGKYGDNSIG